ncbi:hypothetical protein I4F81_000969 [Pyropia yezoensis]|uniref:Uncharacterized protein n=1 Tax=Pyropia yezoensis TaxID=2788 RepID=A0ACC3BK93_PYRYE|nr:hypothetical protein I4F81_000969 [Neopyropia yezoensis]
MPPAGAPLRRAVVLLSGGLDSATALAMTLATGARVRTLSFDYGQRHRAELDAAAALAAASAGAGVEDHRVATIDLAAFGGSSLLRLPPGGVGDTAAAVGRGAGWEGDLQVPKDRDLSATTGSGGGGGGGGEGGGGGGQGGGGGGGGGADGGHGGDTAIPNTYVPARNTIFLAYALGLAEVSRASSIVIGANAVDYSGYPDCRPAYFDAWRPLAAVATAAAVTPGGGGAVAIETPLLHMSKADIVREGLRLGVDFAATHSCYDPVGGRGGEGGGGGGRVAAVMRAACGRRRLRRWALAATRRWCGGRRSRGKGGGGGRPAAPAHAWQFLGGRGRGGAFCSSLSMGRRWPAGGNGWLVKVSGAVAVTVAVAVAVALAWAVAVAMGMAGERECERACGRAGGRGDRAGRWGGQRGGGPPRPAGGVWTALPVVAEWRRRR